MPAFMLYALFSGLGVAIISSLLGSFVVWRRMAYFGDTLAHSALLGVSLGFLLDININLAVIFCSILLAVILSSLQKQSLIASDTLLGIISHSALAVGLVVSHLIGSRIDLMAYLFGDLLATGYEDLLWIYGGGFFAGLIILLLWRPLIAITIHEELAAVEGIKVERIKLALTLLVALVIAIAMKIVGLLLITSLLIIPAASARCIVRTPEQMVLVAALLGSLAVAGGLVLSWFYDTPAAPSVVVVSLVIFMILNSVTFANK